MGLQVTVGGALCKHTAPPCTQPVGSPGSHLAKPKVWAKVRVTILQRPSLLRSIFMELDQFPHGHRARGPGKLQSEQWGFDCQIFGEVETDLLRQEQKTQTPQPEGRRLTWTQQDQPVLPRLLGQVALAQNTPRRR